MKNFKEYLKKTKEYSNADGSVLNDKIRGNLTVAGIGAGVGLVLAVSRKENLVIYSMIGAIVGVTLMTIVKPKINE